MAIEWMDGLEAIANTQDINRRYSIVSTDTTPSYATPGRLGWGRMISENSQVTLETPALKGGDLATRRAGYSFYVDTPAAGGDDNVIMYFADGAGTRQVQLVIDSSDDGTGLFSLSVERAEGSPVSLGSTGEVFPYATYLHIELEVTIHNSAGAFELRVNQVDRLSDSGIDTQVTGNATCDRVAFGTHKATSCRIDDFHGNNDIGDNTGFLGEQQIESPGAPASEGDADDWVPSSGTDNALMIDEHDTTPADDAATHIASGVDNQEDLYNYPALTNIPAGAVTAVNIRTQAALTVVGSRDFRHRVKQGAVTADGGGSQAVTGTGYGFFEDFMDEDPTTTTAWTKATVDSAQFGEKSVA